MQIMNSIICSNKDRRIFNILQDPEINLEDIFYKYIKKGSHGCWNWCGSKLSTGYGQMKLSSNTAYTHRISYILFKGLIPLRYQIDHKCGNRSCCNPEHLEAVTPHENRVRAGILGNKRKKLSHEYFKRGIDLDEQKYQKRWFRKKKMLYIKKKIITSYTIELRFRKFLNNL